MAAPTLAEIRTGLATNLDAIPDIQATAYKLKKPQLPCVFVLGPADVDYLGAFKGGLNNWTLIVVAFAGTVSDQGAQKVLDALIGPTGTSSVKAAIESDPTLGGKVSQAVVRSCSGYREYALEAQPAGVAGAEWTVQIAASGA